MHLSVSTSVKGTAISAPNRIQVDISQKYLYRDQGRLPTGSWLRVG